MPDPSPLPTCRICGEPITDPEDQSEWATAEGFRHECGVRATSTPEEIAERDWLDSIMADHEARTNETAPAG